MSFRLARDAKILKPADYKIVFNQGKMLRGKFWQVKALNTEKNPRLGLAISKKVHKLAVVRNRFKRIAREVFRQNKQDFKHWEIVVMARHAEPASNQKVAQDLLTLLLKTTR
jgi:ribonuclease P protein component